MLEVQISYNNSLIRSFQNTALPFNLRMNLSAHEVRKVFHQSSLTLSRVYLTEDNEHSEK